MGLVAAGFMEAERVGCIPRRIGDALFKDIALVDIGLSIGTISAITTACGVRSLKEETGSNDKKT